MGGIPGVVAFHLQQLHFTAQGRQLCLLGGIGLPQITDLVTAGIELRIKTFLRQLRHIQALFEQGQLSVMRAGPALQLPDKSQQRHARHRQAQQNAVQVQGHNPSAHGKRARLTKLRSRRQLSLRSC